VFEHSNTSVYFSVNLATAHPMEIDSTSTSAGHSKVDDAVEKPLHDNGRDVLMIHDDDEEPSGDVVTHDESLIIPVELRPLLAVAVCLEEPMREDVLACVLRVSSVSELIEMAADRGILVHAGETGAKQQKYKFGNGEKRDAVKRILLMDEADLQEMHQRIGRRILRSGLDSALALEHFRLAEDSLQSSSSEEKYYQLAEACLDVGKEFFRSSDFRSAAETLNFGVRLLNRSSRRWRDHYDLSLALYQASAEANHCVSDYDKAMTNIQEVKKNARTFRDTVTVCATEIYILGMKGRRNEAIDVGLVTLRKLGVHICPRPRKMHLIIGMIKLHYLVRRKTREHILRLPEMTDETSIAAMQMLNLTYSLVFSARPTLIPLVVFHVIKLTLEHGASVMSSVGFAVCGMILCGSGDTDIGLRYAEVALDLYARFPAREWLPRVYAGVYGGVYACAKSPVLSLAPLRHGHRVGLETGDTEVSCTRVTDRWKKMPLSLLAYQLLASLV